MAVIKTERNKVVADDPEPDDVFVRVTWHGPDEDGRHLRAFNGPVEPIGQYQATIDWAVSMADFMRFPLYVVPLRAGDVMGIERMRTTKQ